MLSKFSHVMLYAKDVERALNWYRDKLGFSVTANYAPHYAMLFHEEMNFRLDLHPDRQGGNVGHGAQVYFHSDGIDATISALRAKEIEVTEPKSESGGAIRFSDFFDSEGNKLGLWETVKR
jgi:predicted enzyme related to lactoylglutathione lyase